MLFFPQSARFVLVHTRKHLTNLFAPAAQLCKFILIFFLFLAFLKYIPNIGEKKE